MGLMPRGPASRADTELMDYLSARGLSGSPAQFERWRRAGVLPRNRRRGAGQGRGSVAALHPDAGPIAAALTEHTRQGLDLRHAILRWFIAAPRYPTAADTPQILEPPLGKVRDSAVWSIQRSSAFQLFQRAKVAVTDTERDAFYADSESLTRRKPGPLRAEEVIALRHALTTGDGLDSAPAGTAPADRGGILHLAAATAFGLEEVGLQALAHSIASAGMFPQMTAQDWDQVAAEHEANPHMMRSLPQLRWDPVGDLLRATDQQLLRARIVLTGLAGFGVFYLMHGFLMPDTTGQQALRSAVDELGLATVVIGLAGQLIHPKQIARALVTCLSPPFDGLYEHLATIVRDSPPLMTGGDTAAAEAFMVRWLATIRAVSDPDDTNLP